MFIGKKENNSTYCNRSNQSGICKTSAELLKVTIDTQILTPPPPKLKLQCFVELKSNLIYNNVTIQNLGGVSKLTKIKVGNNTMLT